MSATNASHHTTDAVVRRVAASGNGPIRRGAIVVGASSGMGEALVRQLAREGYTVGAVARRGDKLEALAKEMELEPGRVLPLMSDVTRTGQAGADFAQLANQIGQVELFIFAAGVMPEVGLTEYDTEKDMQQVEVNLAGAMAWCNEAAKLFQSQRSGTLVGIGSVAGDRGRKGNPAYHATKAGFATYLESLRNRLSEVGVHVLTIKPGMVETPMTEHMDELMWPISAEEAADTTLGSARRGFFNTRYVPMRWWAVGTVIRSIPSFIFKKMSI